MPATFQNLPELTVQVLHFAIICSYALAVHNTLPYCQDQRDKSPLPEHQLQSPKSTPLRICSEKKEDKTYLTSMPSDKEQCQGKQGCRHGTL